MDWSASGFAEGIIDECYERYCSPQSAERAKSLGDVVGHNRALRIRDFAAVVECDHAIHCGDVGRSIAMWKMWAMMAHGVNGLQRYALHLTRTVILLEEDLPKPLATIAKHSLIIPSSEVKGHCVAKDFYLETQNYKLKHLHNSAVRSPFDLYHLTQENVVLRQHQMLTILLSGKRNKHGTIGRVFQYNPGGEF